MPDLQPVQTEDVALILCHPIDMRCGRGQVRSLFCRTRTGSQRARSKPAIQAEAADTLAISVLQKLRPGDRRSGCAFEVDVKCAPFVLAARLIAAVYPSELTGSQRSLAGIIQLRPKLRVSGVQITVRLLENLVEAIKTIKIIMRMIARAVGQRGRADQAEESGKAELHVKFLFNNKGRKDVLF
jgi:hypothetical protein